MLNLLNSALINMNSSGETLPDEPSDEPVDIDYTELVDTVLDYIGTDIYVDLTDNNINDLVSVNLLGLAGGQRCLPER